MNNGKDKCDVEEPVMTWSLHKRNEHCNS